MVHIKPHLKQPNPALLKYLVNLGKPDNSSRIKFGLTRIQPNLT